METTFVLKPNELNANFLATIKKLFNKSSQLQISVSSPEDFELLSIETREVYLRRVERCAAEMKLKEKTLSFTEDELSQIIFDNL